MKKLLLYFGVLYTFALTIPASAQSVLITEIMYDPNSPEDDWEWIEIYNAGASTLDLTGYVIDDINSVAHTSANIAGGLLEAEQTAILFNADDITAADFEAAWGSGINLIPVTTWSAMALNNSGDKIGLWSDFASYSGDNTTHANAIITIDYGAANFPDPIGASIYLTDLSADSQTGTNWMASTDGATTPLGTAITSVAAAGNTGSDIGSPISGGSSPAAVVINEALISHTGTDNTEFVELFGQPGTALEGLSLIAVSNDFAPGQVDYRLDFGVDDLLGDNGFFLIGNPAGLSGNYGVTPNISFSNDAFFNNDQTLALVQTATLTAMEGEMLTGDEVAVDAVAFQDTQDDGTTGKDFSFLGNPPVLGPDGNFLPAGGRRVTDGQDTDDVTGWVLADFNLGPDNTPTAGTGDIGGGDPELVFIHDIQGSGLMSPLDGQAVIIEGIVVGDFQEDTQQINGFFVQEEDSDADADAATSEGIFVFEGNSMVDVAVGDKVRVTGTVDEYFDLTELTSISEVVVLSSGNPLPAPIAVTLPFANADAIEAFEGMYITLPQTLTVTNNFLLGRAGEFEVTFGDLLRQPTQVAEPGTAANALQQQNNLNRLVVDDGQLVQNPDPVVYPDPELTAENTLRTGYQVSGLQGVLTYSWSGYSGSQNAYRLHPTTSPTFAPANPRMEAPPAVEGELKIASFNVLNYFTTLDQSGNMVNGQEPRGADNAEEFERQRAKILNALFTINADVVGLIELENDASVSLQNLVDGLNDLYGTATYNFINTGIIGTDAIKVGIIYKTATVSPEGAFAILDSSVDPNFIDDKNRPALAQTLSDDNGKLFTVVVNHLKSKGSDCNDVGDPDTGDGQGNCNQTRVMAAEALVEWLNNDPTDAGNDNYFLLGDFNAYAQEDPVEVLLNAGYVNLAAAQASEDEFVYSYQFGGQFGTLDYIFASAALAPKVTGATEWHINADEPVALDYNLEFFNDRQDELYYNEDPFRASDHDPVIVGFSLSLPAPTGLMAEPKDDCGRAIISWENVTDADFYEYRIQPEGVNYWRQTRTNDPNNPDEISEEEGKTFVNLNVPIAPQANYNFEVRAVYTDGATSTWTNISFTTTGTREAPANLTASEENAESAVLSWDMIDCAEYYEYRLREKGSGSGWRQSRTNDPNNNTQEIIAPNKVKILELQPDQNYEWQVRTVYAHNQSSDWSELAYFSTALALELGDCTYALDDFQDAAEIIAIAPVTYADFYKKYRSYVVGIATGIRKDGRAGAWELHNDCSVHPLYKLLFETSLLPNIRGVERFRGWHYEPFDISDDGHYIFANAINTDGYTHPLGGTVEPGTVVPVKFTLGSPLFGRILGVSGSIECDPNVVSFWWNYFVTGCKEDEVPAQSEPEPIAKSISKYDESLASGEWVQLYPNPVEDILHINIESNQEERATYTIYDLQGKPLIQKEVQLLKGSNQVTLDTTPWLITEEYVLFHLSSSSQGIYQTKLLIQ